MLQEFVIPSVLMGLGIAVDVAIATVVRFRDASMTFRSWTAPVALAHVLLPAIGYYLWWYLGTSAPALSLPLGILAFALISLFLLEAFCEWIDAKPPIAISDIATRAMTRDGAAPGRFAGFMAVMAVSMDALWSGPAKAAQVSSGGWDTSQVMTSFLIAGLVVALVAEAALLIATQLRRIRHDDLTRMSIILVLGKFAELTVLGGFGFLALWNAFGAWFGYGSLFTCLGIAAGVSLLLWVIYWRRLVATQQSELAVEGAA